jgi:16S rRNA C967 or C1407 C5-methylase (RsmB/RsmF family)
MSHYFLDLSSIFPALMLPISSNSRVLDMCSAPGGKLLVMLSRLVPEVFYVANDLSYARTQRLKRVIKDFVPEDVFRRSIKVTNVDAIRFALQEPASFDAVLLDAPCSSEAHVVRDRKLLQKFTGLRKSLPQRQFALLSAALLAVKPGGHVMYSTCSINLEENEGVIKKALARKKRPCAVIGLTSPVGAHSDLGVTILPHVHGAGPAFFSLLKRL